AAFAGICVLSSVMATSGNAGKVKKDAGREQVIRDSVPGKKKDTSSYPKRDTTARLDQQQH
ncbi:MAG TPA: hypothetical protein VII28_06550, partial [Puia sp.]